MCNKKILGISAFYHDSACALVIGGEVIAAAQEERFTRLKHTRDFPTNSIKYCLEYSGLQLDDFDAIVFYDKPLLKFERLLETYYAFAPKGILSFLTAIPFWLKEKIFLKKLILDKLDEVGKYNRKKITLLFSEHHLSHAASAFYPSPFSESAILTIDGVGEWCTTSIGFGKENKISILREMNFPHSVGLLYSSFTYYLGFTVNSGEFKLMGLAPYGSPLSEETLEFIKLIKSHLVDIKGDGSIWLNQNNFTYATSRRMVNDKKWEKLFGFPRREPEMEIQQHHCNLALAIQKVTEEIILKIAKEAKRITSSENVCLAGGVALNCVANGKLLNSGIFKNIYIQPAAGDAGGSLGAALAVHFMYFNGKKINPSKDQMQGSYLGPDYSNKEVKIMNRRVNARFQEYNDFEVLADIVADEIAKGKVIGWFQGRMEFGPRALGNRSILGDPRDPEMQKKLNLKVKYREGFRPFAPSVLWEDVKDYFQLDSPSPYMMFVAPLRQEHTNYLPENFHELSFWDKLYYKRSDVQAITHLDYSARIQTVHKETNSRFWHLIHAFKKKTDHGILINTSFNVRGEPIVCTPYDAYRCFMSTEIDLLVINDFLYHKTDQVGWEDKEKWNIKFNKD